MSTVTGKVSHVGETQTFGKNFRKRIFVLEQDEGRYTNLVPCTLTRDGCDEADALKVGDKVEVDYKLSGRKWQKDDQSEVRYFVDVEVQSFRVTQTQMQADTEFGEPAPPIPDREMPEKNTPKPEPLQGTIPF